MSIEDYTAGVIAARDAYRADRLVEQGICASCERRKRDWWPRKCWTCRHQKERK